jgi:flagellar motor switch/type III secretory pathway protein FliN
MSNIEIPVKVILAKKKLKFGEILKLTEGSIIEFAQPVTADATLLVDNMEFAKGIIVKTHGKFGLQIRSIIKKPS